MTPIPNPAFHSETNLTAIINEANLAAAPASLPKQIPFGEYIFRRLRQINVKSVFGVPGDFNLNLLDHIKPIDDLKWIGCCNELNAGYAADGYARFTRGIGCLITTFGVGELSAINAISGAFSEYSGVLHIVGTSPTTYKNSKGQVHHLVPSRNPYDDTPNHRVYENMVDGVCIAKESIDDVVYGMKQVDFLIEKIISNSRPGYLFLPLDLQDKLVDSSRLNIPLKLDDIISVNNVSSELVIEVAKEILNKLYESKNPAIVADVLTDRFRASTILRELVSLTKINNYSTPMGKSVLDETNESYIGDYNGKLSNPGIQNAVESSDCVIHVGSYFAETNTGKYSTNFKEDALIILNPFYVKIGNKLIRDMPFILVLKEILKLINLTKIPTPIRPANVNTMIERKSKAEISQSYLTKQIQNYIKPYDVLISETCSFQFAFSDIKLPKNSLFFCQAFYLSIGYAIPATLGIGLAMKDNNHPGRLILFEGDGSAQMTIQEFATYMRQDIKPTIFLLNNNGYTVERLIHGLNEDYNDIQPNWDWCNIFKTFGDKNGNKSFSKKIITKEDLEETLNDKELMTQKKIQLYEVILDKYDAPWRFIEMMASKK